MHEKIKINIKKGSGRGAKHVFFFTRPKDEKRLETGLEFMKAMSSAVSLVLAMVPFQKL